MPTSHDRLTGIGEATASILAQSLCLNALPNTNLPSQSGPSVYFIFLTFLQEIIDKGSKFFLMNNLQETICLQGSNVSAAH